jgi:hypothetical protein
VISRRQWADFGPPKPIKAIPTAKIETIKLIHFLPFGGLFNTAQMLCQEKFSEKFFRLFSDFSMWELDNRDNA